MLGGGVGVGQGSSGKIIHYTPLLNADNNKLWQCIRYCQSFSSRYLKITIISSQNGEDRTGGPEGIRTHDLSDANRTLSQLSYRPKR